MIRIKIHWLLLVACLALTQVIAPLHAQTTTAVVVPTCGTPPTTYTAGQNRLLTQDTTGVLCTPPAVKVTPPPAAPHNFPGCTVGTTSATCLAANTAVAFLQVQNTSASATVSCAFGAAAVLNSTTSFVLAPGQSASWGSGSTGVPSGALNCIASAASTPLYVEWN